jgi:SAM-dependent methyltransferase
VDPVEWRDAMQVWALPESILSAAPESPWGFPIEPFRTRVEHAEPGVLTFSNRRALDALPQDGEVLDVGVGTGAASLPLHPRCARIVGVDSSRALLTEFRRQARRIGATIRTVEGSWPSVGRRTPVVDVVVCNHVAYNVADLAPFAIALTQHARNRVVMEITIRHPTAWMADLWLRFHGLDRPTRPDAGDAVSLLRGLGLPVRRHTGLQARGAGGFARREDAVAWIRRRLCLGADRDADVAAALGSRLVNEDGLWAARPPAEPVVTIWWDTAQANGGLDRA